MNRGKKDLLLRSGLCIEGLTRRAAKRMKKGGGGRIPWDQLERDRHLCFAIL